MGRGGFMMDLIFSAGRRWEWQCSKEASALQSKQELPKADSTQKKLPKKQLTKN